MHHKNMASFFHNKIKVRDEAAQNKFPISKSSKSVPNTKV